MPVTANIQVAITSRTQQFQQGIRESTSDLKKFQTQAASTRAEVQRVGAVIQREFASRARGARMSRLPFSEQSNFVREEFARAADLANLQSQTSKAATALGAASIATRSWITNLKGLSAALRGGGIIAGLSYLTSQVSSFVGKLTEIDAEARAGRGGPTGMNRIAAAYAETLPGGIGFELQRAGSELGSNWFFPGEKLSAIEGQRLDAENRLRSLQADAAGRSESRAFAQADAARRARQRTATFGEFTRQVQERQRLRNVELSVVPLDFQLFEYTRSVLARGAERRQQVEALNRERGQNRWSLFEHELDKFRNRGALNEQLKAMDVTGGLGQQVSPLMLGIGGQVGRREDEKVRLLKAIAENTADKTAFQAAWQP